MQTIQTLPVKEGRLLRLNRIFSRPLWTPQADEKRFLAGYQLTFALIIILWKQGLGDPLGGYSIPVNIVLWCAAYVIRFWQRLMDRGELKRVIIALAALVALLLGFEVYARW